MDTPLWIVDAATEERMAAQSCGRPRLSEAARAAGHRVAIASLSDGRLSWEGTPPPQGPAILHGSFGFVAAVRDAGWREPFPINETTRFDVTQQKAWLRKRLLNAGGATRTLADLLDEPTPTSPVFLRPSAYRTDDHVKAFPGKPLFPMEWAPFLDSLVAKGLPLDTAIVQAPFQTLHAEARHLIVGGRLVSSSIYRFQNRLQVLVDSYPEQRAVARAVARKAHQPAFAYVCDTAVVGDGAAPRQVKVVEMNAFASSGLYGLDTRRIAKAFAGHWGQAL